jgi:hypothetical protein
VITKMSFVVVGHYAGGQSYVVFGPETKSNCKIAIKWSRRFYPKVTFTIRAEVT